MSINYYIHKSSQITEKELSALRKLKTDVLALASKSCSSAGCPTEIINELRGVLDLAEAKTCGSGEIHIGKQSDGWRFLFADYRSSFAAWSDFIMKCEGFIFDEYRRPVSAVKMMTIITDSAGGKSFSHSSILALKDSSTGVTYGLLPGRFL